MKPFHRELKFRCILSLFPNFVCLYSLLRPLYILIEVCCTSTVLQACAARFKATRAIRAIRARSNAAMTWTNTRGDRRVQNSICDVGASSEVTWRDVDRYLMVRWLTLVCHYHRRTSCALPGRSFGSSVLSRSVLMKSANDDIVTPHCMGRPNDFDAASIDIAPSVLPRSIREPRLPCF